MIKTLIGPIRMPDVVKFITSVAEVYYGSSCEMRTQYPERASTDYITTPEIREICNKLYYDSKKRLQAKENMCFADIEIYTDVTRGFIFTSTSKECKTRLLAINVTGLRDIINGQTFPAPASKFEIISPYGYSESYQSSWNNKLEERINEANERFKYYPGVDLVE